MKVGVQSDTLSSVGRAGHDIGLGALIGGNLFARVAMHPALSEISDERERGKVLNRSWRRYGTVNLIALGAVVGGWAGARTDEARPGALSGRERDLAVAKDVAVTVVAATGIAAAAQGMRFAGSEPDGAVPLDTGDRTSAAASDTAARRKRRINAIGSAHLVSALSLPVSTRRCRSPDFAARLCAGFCAGATDKPASRPSQVEFPNPLVSTAPPGSERRGTGRGRARSCERPRVRQSFRHFGRATRLVVRPRRISARLLAGSNNSQNRKPTHS